MSASDWRVYAGIDPGATTGLVAIALPAGSFRVVDARLAGFATVTSGTSAHESKAAVRARLFHKIRAQLAAWNAETIVVEEPWDALPSWNTRMGGKNRTGGASRGTLFTLGTHFGLALAAASDLPWATSVVSYPVTSARAQRRRPERVGWMQRRQPQCPAHERVALEHALQLRELKRRPLDGVLPSAAALAREEADDVYMALGVLSFHLDRQRGIV